MTTLYDRALSKRKCISFYLMSTSFDDADCDNLCFETQQCLEFLMKWKLESIGIAYPKTHSIRVLADTLQANGVDVYSIQNLDARAESIAAWETESRYGKGVLTTKLAVDIAVQIVDDLFKLVCPNDLMEIAQF